MQTQNCHDPIRSRLRFSAAAPKNETPMSTVAPKRRRHSVAGLVALLAIGAVVTPTAAIAAPAPHVGIHKKIVKGPGNPLSTWTVGHTGSFSVVVTNTTTLHVSLASGSYIVEEHVPAGLTVTSIGGGGALGSWSCTPAVPQTGPVTITCTFPLAVGPGGPFLYPGDSLPPLVVDVHVDAPPASNAGGYTNCAEIIEGGGPPGGGMTFLDAPNPSCTTAKPLILQAESAVCVEKFLDHDGDTVHDRPEPLLSGVTFVLRHARRNRFVGKITSSATETACLHTKSGRYFLTERPRPGWVPTRPPGGTRTVKLRPRKPTLVTFGNRPDSQLCVHKFEDLDADGVFDPGESTIPDWHFDATSEDSTVSLVTGGEHACAWVVPGTYTVSEVPQNGWIPTAPASGVQTIEVQPMTSALVTFGNTHKPCCLTFTYLGGTKDEFSSAGAAEPANPIASTDPQRFFDETSTNVGLAHRTDLGVAGNCVSEAILTTRMKSLGGNSDNDVLTIQVPGDPPKHFLMTSVSGTGWTGGVPPQTFTFDLAALPDGSSILSSLEAIRRLDVLVQDDTSVDFIELKVKFCECGPVEPMLR